MESSENLLQIKAADNLIDIKELENRLFDNLAKWNNETYIGRLKLCDRIKLSKKIDSLNYEYSVSLAMRN
jgi:hypothetical protein